MNWAQFKGPVFHMCLASTMVVSWFLTQEVGGSSPFTVMTNIFVTELNEFSETLRKSSNVFRNICWYARILLECILVSSLFLEQMSKWLNVSILPGLVASVGDE